MATETLSSVEQTAMLANEIFSKLPLAYKRLITIPDWQMVLGGLKATTNYGFLGNTWNEEEFHQFKRVLEGAGLRVTDPAISYGNSEIPFRQGHLFNAATLVATTANSEFAPPYDGKVSLDEYIAQAVALGYPQGGVYGKIYSFPESAIRDFLSPFRTDSEEDQQKRESYHNGNETYWIYPPAQADVTEREALKERFFTSLEKNPDMMKMLNSRDLQRSNEEWRDRLPDYTKRREAKRDERSGVRRLFQRVRNWF